MERYASVAPGDGFDRWHFVTCRNYSVTECRRVPDRHFRASVDARPVGPLVVSEIASRVSHREPLRVVRTEREVRRDGRDDFLLWVALEGTTSFEQDGRTVALRPGDLVMHDQARPFVLDFGAAAHAMMVTVPRARMEACLADAADRVALRVEADRPAARLFATVARELAGAASALPAGCAERLCAAALEIWSAAIEDAAGRAAPTAHGSRLARVKRYARARLEDASLDTASMAAGCHLSTRTLARLFASEGTTPMRWVWEQRLEASYRDLATGRAPRVTDAALSWGFRDLSHFSRSFRARFGRPPNRVLAGTRAPSARTADRGA